VNERLNQLAAPQGNASGVKEPIFTIFSPNEMCMREFYRSWHLFPITQGTLPWQPILGKIC